MASRGTSIIFQGNKYSFCILLLWVMYREDKYLRNVINNAGALAWHGIIILFWRRMHFAAKWKEDVKKHYYNTREGGTTLIAFRLFYFFGKVSAAAQTAGKSSLKMSKHGHRRQKACVNRLFHAHLKKKRISYYEASLFLRLLDLLFFVVSSKKRKIKTVLGANTKNGKFSISSPGTIKRCSQHETIFFFMKKKHVPSFLDDV